MGKLDEMKPVVNEPVPCSRELWILLIGAMGGFLSASFFFAIITFICHMMKG